MCVKCGRKVPLNFLKRKIIYLNSFLPLGCQTAAAAAAAEWMIRGGEYLARGVHSAPPCLGEWMELGSEWAPGTPGGGTGRAGGRVAVMFGT